MAYRTLCGDDAAFPQRTGEQLEVVLLEQALSRSLWIAAVRDDDVELASFAHLGVLAKVLEAVVDDDFDLGVLETDAHAGQEFLGQANDSFVNVDQSG